MHTSMSLGHQVYVACGYNDKSGKFLSSVEMLRMGAQAWVLINIPELTLRHNNPIFSQIDADNICILGGPAEIEFPFCNGLLLDAETGAVVRQIRPVSDIKFICMGQSFQKTSGEIVSLVVSINEINCKKEVHMISYNQAEDTITTIKNYGKLR